ncbi:MAG: sugar ABC transporter substrate-binding protein [Deinococcota bacterium]
MKKILFTLSLVLFIGLASAQPMQYWKFGAPEEPANVALAGWVDQWNAENPDTPFEARFFPFGEYASGTPLVTAFASGSGPDVFWASPGTFMQFARSGIAADLSDLFTDDVRADFLPAALEAVTVDGVPVAMPFEQEPVALFYNIDLLEQVGLDVPQTWDELLAAAEVLDAADIIPVVIETPPGPYQNFTWYPFLWQNGGDAADSALTEATFDTPEAAEALDLWRTLIQDGYAPRTAPDCTCNIASTPFASGEAAMQVVGMWAIGVLNSEFPDINYGVTHLPTPTGEDPVTVYGGWTQMVNARSENLDAAKAFTAWMWSQDTERPVEWVTVINSKFSPRLSVTEAAAEYYDQEHLNTFRDIILPTARAEPRYPAEMVQIIGDALQASMFRNTPGEQTAADAQRQLERFLQSY